MAGLNSLVSGTTTETTALPSWMTAAQQDVANNAKTAAANVPQLSNTVAQGAINQLNSANNPFTSATSALNTIASGAANPWITDASGNVTPNTGTALGGLFAAQNQQLHTLIPQITSGADASGIGSGNFGSLRGQTAADTALTNAQANLTAAQMQAALSNQQNGVQAANAEGNVANLYGTDVGNLANLQQTAPLATAANVGKIISNLGKTDTTVTNSAQAAPLQQISAILSTLGGGTNALNSLLNTLSPGTTLGSLFGSLFNSAPSGSIDVSQGLTLANGQNLSYGDPVTGTGTNGGPGAGQVMGTDGKVYNDPSYGNTDSSSQVWGGIPDGVTVDPNTGMGSDGVDYSGLLQGP